MEFLTQKPNKSRKRKRLLKNRRRNRQKAEVKLLKYHKHVQRFNITKSTAVCFDFPTMAANSFWENYKIAHDWQHRHSVVWWKSRCTALEHENQILRNKIRQCSGWTQQSNNYHRQNVQNWPSNEIEEENLEFCVGDDMMKFLEQSIRHKMELKEMRARESDTCSTSNDWDSGEVEGCNDAANAELLYGKAVQSIVATETALQASINHHKDYADPHYWPNIPLKP